MKQDRYLIITSNKIYSLKKKKNVRRMIKIKNLKGVTINLNKPNELVIHINNEIDIRLLSEHRKRLID